MKRALWTLGLAGTLLRLARAPMVFGQQSGRSLSLSPYRIIVSPRCTSVERVRKAIASAVATSWFYRQIPSIDADSVYSRSGSLIAAADKVRQ